MIKGRIVETLNMENILKKVNAYDVYRFYMGRDFKLNIPTHSPMPGRKDKNPSFIIGDKYGELFHIDFADTRFRGDCFNFVQQIYSLSSLSDALSHIDQFMGLGIRGASTRDYKKIISQYEQPTLEKKKKYSLIQIKVRPFTTEELDWWLQYHQTEEDLRNEKIFSIQEAYLNRQKLKLAPVRFAYMYGDRIKLYQPLEQKDKKWITNVPYHVIDGLTDIKKVKKALVIKAKKDKMVIKKFFPNVCSVQGEGVTSIDPESMLYLRENSEEQWLCFDNDKTGREMSEFYVQNFGMKTIFTPDVLLAEGIKDFADMARYKGLAEVQNYFKQKELYEIF